MILGEAKPPQTTPAKVFATAMWYNPRYSSAQYTRERIDRADKAMAAAPCDGDRSG
jgi:hypothetical protein